MANKSHLSIPKISEVDIVTTWVDGSDTSYLAQYNAYAKVPKHLNPERYRDPFDFLRYSLRSVRTYIPWVRKIYIVTARAQCPSWLNPEHPQIELVHHDQIIEERYLPTFSSNVIESYLHRIPELADHFMFMNDDFLFGKPTSLDTYYRDGRYTVFNTLFGENLGWRLYEKKNNIIGLGIIEHTPFLANKVIYEQAFDILEKEVELTRRNQFREPTDLVAYKLYRYCMLKYHQHCSRIIPVTALVKEHLFHKLLNNEQKQLAFFNKLRKQPVATYCLNDDLGSTPNQDVIEIVRRFLAESYPIPAPWEI